MMGLAARRGIAAAWAAFGLLSLALFFTFIPYGWMDDGPRGFFPLELLTFVASIFFGLLAFGAIFAMPLFLGLLGLVLALGAARGRAWAWSFTKGILALLAVGCLMWALLPSGSYDGGPMGIRAGPTPLVRVADLVLAALCAWGAWALHRASRDAPSG